ATLAGVALAFTLPMYVQGGDGERASLVKEVEQGLHFWVAFLILPLFAFVNAGINVTNIDIEQMAGPVPLGIMLGLFLGKQLGVFGFSWVAIKLKIAVLPERSSWWQLYGVSLLTGVGFTMSLFITSLAFEQDDLFQYTDKLAIIIGSLLSGTIGYTTLRLTLSTIAKSDVLPP
ncbi:MAG: Na+/H+ antiporter NhaA, partial [Mariprofundales bacterium]|nr:Na+/H+ antiporter NhaA [Mariprofundales bacterium]